jgi:hypothetical protein
LFHSRHEFLVLDWYFLAPRELGLYLLIKVIGWFRSSAEKASALALNGDSVFLLDGDGGMVEETQPPNCSKTEGLS